MRPRLTRTPSCLLRSFRIISGIIFLFSPAVTLVMAGPRSNLRTNVVTMTCTFDRREALPCLALMQLAQSLQPLSVFTIRSLDHHSTQMCWPQISSQRAMGRMYRIIKLSYRRTKHAPCRNLTFYQVNCSEPRLAKHVCCVDLATCVLVHFCPASLHGRHMGERIWHSMVKHCRQPSARASIRTRPLFQVFRFSF